jgi:hypothetical protein
MRYRGSRRDSRFMEPRGLTSNSLHAIGFYAIGCILLITTGSFAHLGTGPSKINAQSAPGTTDSAFVG